MSEIDPQTEATLDKLENVLKDGFSHYLLVAVDGEETFHFFSSETVAVGMCKFVEDTIRKSWTDN